MSKQRKSAYGAPPEEKEVVITMDRRLLAVGALLVTLVAALALGLWWGRRDETQVAAAPPVAENPSVNQAGSQPTLSPDEAAHARETAGLPPSAVIINPNERVEPADNPFVTQLTPAVPPVQNIPPVVATTAAGSLPLDNPVPGVGEDPGVDITGSLPKDPKGSDWTPDVLAGMPDPNLSETDSQGRGVEPVRIETVKEPLSGPRLGLSDLNEQYTYNYGVVPIREIAKHDFVAQNVGDEDLIISRVYAGCGCTATVFGGTKIKADGFLPAPVTLKPGESRPFTVEFDPRAEGVTIAQSKYIQIYSNDPTRYLFDDNEPLSHEVRMRIVVQPKQ